MDIQVASNFERFLYYFLEGDSKQVCQFMSNFRQTGSVRLEKFSDLGFSSSRVSDPEIPEIIKSIHAKYGYLVDPHTACSFKDLDPDRPHLVLATAHPAKFPAVIQEAGLPEPIVSSLETLKDKEIVRYSVEPTKESIERFILENIG
jgi:threonine synthase